MTFQGSHSPGLQEARRRLRAGEFGRLLNIDAPVWQDWKSITAGTWRQDVDQFRGGFLFDTGAHMLNTVADLAGEDFAGVAAWLESDDGPVDARGVIMGRLAGGAGHDERLRQRDPVLPFGHPRVHQYGAILRTDVWGEKVELQLPGSTRARRMRPPAMSIWQQYLATRAGTRENPCPPEVGLRMARLWDAIRASAAQGGRVIENPAEFTASLSLEVAIS